MSTTAFVGPYQMFFLYTHPLQGELSQSYCTSSHMVVRFTKIFGR